MYGQRLRGRRLPAPRDSIRPGRCAGRSRRL